MQIGTLVLLIASAVVFLHGVGLHNGLVALKHNISKAWSNIDVLLKQRHDELPKLVEVAKQHMAFEKDTLERVTTARSAVFAARESGDVGKVRNGRDVFASRLGNLLALAENYPELRADTNFQHLRERITGLENAITDRREFCNESVNINNMRIEQFPDLVIAR